MKQIKIIFLENESPTLRILIPDISTIIALPYFISVLSTLIPDISTVMSTI